MSEFDWTVNHPGKTKKAQPKLHDFTPVELPKTDDDTVSEMKSEALYRLSKYVYWSLKSAGRSVSAQRLKQVVSHTRDLDVILNIIREATCTCDHLYDRAVKQADRYYPVGSEENGELKQRTWEGQPFDQREIVSPIVNETAIEDDEYPDEIIGGPAVRMRFSFLQDLPAIKVQHRGRSGHLHSVAGRNCTVDWFDGGISTVDTSSVTWKLG